MRFVFFFVHKRQLDIRKDTNTAAWLIDTFVSTRSHAMLLFFCATFWLCCCLMQPFLLLLLLQFANICYKVNSLNEKCEQKTQAIYIFFSYISVCEINQADPESPLTT